MCGIAGFVDLDRSTAAPALEATAAAMVDAMLHRGPDDRGVWVDEATGVALGHRRLSIIDLSPGGHQPMLSACGRFVIDFNGELYNYRDLREELARDGTVVHSESDTAVLLAAVAEWGIEAALGRAIGMFAFALWDRSERVLTLARDRLGEKPLYYGRIGATMLFASELKALRVHPAWRGDIDAAALCAQLRHGYIPGTHSIYHDIHKLLPGCFLSLPLADPARVPPLTPVPESAAPGVSAPRRYWSARSVAESGVRDPLEISADEAVERLDVLLRDAVRMQMVSDVPLGAFLSGGIDSSTVVAMMQAQSARPVKTFTIGFHEERYDEAGHAREVAQHLGTEHTELVVTPEEAMSVVPDLPAMYDEPFADPSQIPTALVARLARRSVTVALSGDGGDELFCGYERYFWADAIARRLGSIPRVGRAGAARAIRAADPQAWDRVIRRLHPLLPQRLRLRQPGAKLHKLADMLQLDGTRPIYRRLVSNWSDPESVVIGAREAPTPLSDPDQQDSPWRPMESMMYLDTVTYLPDDILVKLDRACMATSLEGRVPMLDHRVVEFAWQLPYTLRCGDGRGKRVLRDVLRRYVPPALYERPKMGFGVPIAQWLRGALREWAEDLLSQATLERAGLLHTEAVRLKWREHLSGERNWEYELWSVLMFQAWHRALPPLPAARCA